VLRLLHPNPTAKPEPEPTDPAGNRSDPLRLLWSAAELGDPVAQRTLLGAIGPALLRVVRAVLGSGNPDVEDVLQDSMIAVLSALPTFRGDSTSLHFVCRIALKTALKARRRADYRSQHTPPVPAEQLDRIPSTNSSATTDAAFAAAQRRELLRELLCELPSVQAEALALHTMLGYSIEQTAAATSVPINTVRSRLRVALASLRGRVHADQALLDLLRGSL
jgi:RNA polymerase sigma factor (sigma-70 family)